MSDIKRSSIIALALAASLLCGCATVNVNIQKPAPEENKQEESAPEQQAQAEETTDELASFPQLLSDDFDLSRYDDDKNMYFKVQGNTWKLSDESAKQYPDLVAPLKQIEEDQKKYIEDSLDQYDEDARKFAEQLRKDGGDGSYECTADTGLACADPKVVSLVTTWFVFFGGAHPDTTIEAYNIDAVSGQFIPLSAVIADKKGLDEILKDALLKQYPDHDFFGLDESLESMDMALPSFKDDKPAYVYSFNPNGLTFYFNDTVLSPHSDGGEQIDLTFDELATVLDEHFQVEQ